MRVLSSLILATLLVGILAATPAKRAPAKPEAPLPEATAAATSSAEPRDVLARFHHDDLVETEAARLALQSAHDTQVHAFAKVLVADHAACDRMLDDYARAHGLDVGDESADPRAEQEFLSHLKTLRGTDFDHAFVRHIYESHVKEINELLDTRSLVEDQKLRNVLTRIKPKLDQHKNTARSILHRLESPSADR